MMIIINFIFLFFFLGRSGINEDVDDTSHKVVDNFRTVGKFRVSLRQVRDLQKGFRKVFVTIKKEDLWTSWVTDEYLRDGNRNRT